MLINFKNKQVQRDYMHFFKTFNFKVKKEVTKINVRIYEIYRFNKDISNVPWIQYYLLPRKFWKSMALDDLFQLQHLCDGTLSFRRSCREGICGSCAMNIDVLTH